jgi:hypothetical protein
MLLGKSLCLTTTFFAQQYPVAREKTVMSSLALGLPYFSRTQLIGPGFNIQPKPDQ